jgi:hypothetical protein
MLKPFRERPRPHQFEVRYLYGPKAAKERLRTWFVRRVCPLIEFTINVSYLCGLGYVFLLAIVHSTAPQIEQADKRPLDLPAVRGDLKRQEECCALPAGSWLTQTIDTASR